IYFPEYHTKINISNSKNGMNFLLRKKSGIIAVSNSTKNDLLKEFDLPADKLFEIHEAADKQKFNYKINADDKSRARSKYGIANDIPYLICLSTIEPRKNLGNTIKAFMRLIKEHPDTSLKLVIAGKKGWDADSLQLEEDFPVNRIIFTGFVDDQDISYLYSDALAMCYLSFYEGFGLPPLEAMCCGTPVIYGNNSSLIEVVGEGGIPANPYDVDEIKDKLAEICFNEELRLEKSKAALKQSLKFSWRKTVIETLNAYEDTISGNRNLSN
ncbi:MAG: glycosyltransferase family 4 protein, partial [Bacteroidales bacterium]|nr:glycosyltransferase family 4 protein [Bacteroidales bacterium]